MIKILIISFSIVVFLCGQAFTQQESPTILIEFSTVDGTPVPVFEVIGQSFGAASISLGRTSGFATGSGVSFQPAFMAPATMEITNGWHRYQIGEDALFSKKFDIIASGVDQKWLLDPGKPGWNIAGWVMYPIGLMLAIFGAFDWDSYNTGWDEFAMISPNLGSAIAFTIGGGLATVGGITLVFTTLPKAKRIP